ncbi:MAG: Na/Pi cotransporter family protein [Lachnospiraceae bacterium]|nr:Na/Pi cotransporter family protein [Lachnospiraceae bacterium]
MNIFDIISLLGGLAMFLYGMRLMGNSLKENSSGTLKVAMEQVTNNPVKAFVLGVCVTALIQSSTATIVITSGLVGAGILTLHQSLGIIIGANVGTTVTGQIIRLLDLNAEGSTSLLRFLQPSTLAPVALIIGIVIMMSGKVKNANSVGGIAVGFGILFSGLMNMTGAVSNLSASGIVERLFDGLGANPLIGYVTGAGIAFVLQSSSATIGILQAFSMTGHIDFNAIYAVIVGIYLGDCVTTFIVCSIGAKAETRRVGIVNILFNLSETVLVLGVVAILRMIGVLDGIWNMPVNSGVIANTNTIFNLGCAICLFPLLNTYEKLSRKIIKDEPEPEEKYKEKFDALNPVFFNTPALALNSCYDLLLTMFRSARANIDKAYGLLERYDEAIHGEILQEEDEIDKMTDRVSRYSVELLPHLQLDLHVSILNQYYKVTEEFERLGDHAVNIAEHAQSLHESGNAFSETALAELGVLKKLTDEMLDLADKTFRRRNVEAARQIEPLVQVAGDLISRLKTNHLKRMASGECSIYADADFTNLMVAFKRIAAICSNVGVATMVRVKPELADHEHYYYESLHEGGDATFDAALRSARDTWFAEINALSKNSNPSEETAVSAGGQDGTE